MRIRGFESWRPPWGPKDSRQGWWDNRCSVPRNPANVSGAPPDGEILPAAIQERAQSFFRFLFQGRPLQMGNCLLDFSAYQGSETA